VKSETLRVLVADDHPIVAEGLASLLGRMSNVELVGVASNGAHAVELAAETLPDIVIMDLRMPKMDGVEASKLILSAQPDARILVLTMYDDDELLGAAMKAGARGFLLKGATQIDIERALASVSAGEVVFGPGVADQVLSRLKTGWAGSDPFPQLSAREREVLELLAQGYGTQQLARKLFISPKTARNHVSNILTKTGELDRAQLIAHARGVGYGQQG
jgi:DNA-binding NarL/FixJ family response regulator